MTDLDKLSREMAWIEFQYQRVIAGSGITKARHWKSLTEEARQGWRSMAKRFCHFLHRLPVDALNAAHTISEIPGRK